MLARFDEGLELLGEPHLLQHILSSVLAAERSRWPGVDLRASATRDLPAVSGDETSIQQVLRNLISNAAKYSPLDQTIEVVLTAEDGGVSTRVLDHGQGIRAEEAEELFTPFFRSPDTAGLASGAGIGLFVCRRLVDAMGGRIWAAPRDGGGSEFGFWLPAYHAGLDDEDDEWTTHPRWPGDSAGGRSSRTLRWQPGARRRATAMRLQALQPDAGRLRDARLGQHGAPARVRAEHGGSDQMPTVYLRAEALRLPDGAANADGVLAPDADLAITALKECGVNTLLVEAASRVRAHRWGCPASSRRPIEPRVRGSSPPTWRTAGWHDARACAACSSVATTPRTCGRSAVT